MKIILTIILIFTGFFTSFVEDLYLRVFPPSLQKPVLITLRAHTEFSFDQKKALNERRAKALSQYVPIFNYRHESTQQAKTKMVRLTMKVNSLQSGKKNAPDVLQKYLQEEFRLEIDEKELSDLLKYNDLEKLFMGILTLEETILQEKIVEDLSVIGDSKIIQVKLRRSDGFSVHSAQDVISLERANRILKERVQNLFWNVDRRVLYTAIEISTAALAPTLQYNEEENRRRIETIARSFPEKMIHYTPGEVMIPVGRTTDEESMLLLEAYNEERMKDLDQTAVWTALVIVLVALYTAGFYSGSDTVMKTYASRPLPVFIILLVSIRLLLLFTPLPVLVMPLAVIPIVLMLLKEERLRVFCLTLAAAVLVSMFTGGSLEMFLFYSLGSGAGILVFNAERRKSQVLLPLLAVGVVNALLVLSLSVFPATVTGQPGTARMMDNLSIAGLAGLVNSSPVGWAILGGLVSGPLALLVYPLMAMISRSESLIKLKRITDPHHPLLKEIMNSSPGTYQHTMTVAHLAQAVGEAVGADELLLTAGAYYHDLGKMANPDYFAENQFSGNNHHDHMDPRESKEIIIHHVIDGESIARKKKLPGAVIDMIRQHHGTQLVEYFYNKALKNLPDNSVRKADFRYPGPKPQSLEAAILMIADATEAAARSIEDPDRKKIMKMVRHVIGVKLFDGQFDECDLSSRQIDTVIRTLVDSLEASFHSRVKYPWQEEKKRHRNQ